MRLDNLKKRMQEIQNIKDTIPFYDSYLDLRKETVSASLFDDTFWLASDLMCELENAFKNNDNLKTQIKTLTEQIEGNVSTIDQLLRRIEDAQDRPREDLRRSFTHTNPKPTGACPKPIKTKKESDDFVAPGYSTAFINQPPPEPPHHSTDPGAPLSDLFGMKKFSLHRSGICNGEYVPLKVSPQGLDINLVFRAKLEQLLTKRESMLIANKWAENFCVDIKYNEHDFTSLADAIANLRVEYE